MHIVNTRRFRAALCGAFNLAVDLCPLIHTLRNSPPLRLCALARMSLLIQAVVLAKAQRSQREDPGYGWTKFSKTINPRDGWRTCLTSRRRRLNSIVADATWKKLRVHRGLKPTAKFKAPPSVAGAE